MKYFCSAIILGLLVLTSGCAYSEAKLDIRYPTGLNKKGPLSSLKSVRVQVLQFTDKRPQPDKIGYKRNGFGGNSANIVTIKPVPDILHEGIEEMFRKNDHTVINGNADIIVSGDISRFWFESQMNFLTMQFMGTMDINLVIKESATNKVLLSKHYSGHNNEELYSGYHKEMARVMNATLEDLISKIEMDPQLVNSLLPHSTP